MFLDSNLPNSPANAVAVDPENAGTVYVALDAGVFFTTQAGTGGCAAASSVCWAQFGTGLPAAPVTGLIAAPAGATVSVLTAATYGRGMWQTPLLSAETSLTTAEATPGALSFPNQAVGTTSSAQTVTITNTGSVGLAIGQISASANFAETDNCANSTLPEGASCAVQVTFAPGTTGSLTGELDLAANVYGGQIALNLTGTGTPAGTLAVSPTSVNFGGVDVGASSTPPTTVEISNVGSLPVTFVSITATGPFSVSTNFANACGTGPLAAGSACPVTVSFTPVQSGAAAGTLTFTDNAGTQTVELSGSGLSPPTDGLIPGSLVFPSTAENQVSGVQTVTVTNTGDLPLTSILFSVSGEFTIASSGSGSSTGTCGSTLAAHSSCAIGVEFAPAQLGTLTGTLTVSDALRTQTVSLSGTGVAPPAIGVSPASLSFGPQQPGVTSAAQAVTITNTGGAPLSGLSEQLTGSAAGSFSVSSGSCGAMLAAGASCAVQVTFNASTTGGSAAMLNLSSSSPGVAAVNVGLSGTAQTANGLNVSPAALSFGAVLPGATSAAQTVTITNSSGFTALAPAIAVSPEFSWTQETCTGPLAAGASCTIGVSFAPAASGAATGTVTVSSASIATAATVALSGTGAVAPNLQILPGSISFAETGVGQSSAATTITVTNEGTSASLTGLTLTAPAGFTLVNNTCAATLPAGASCTAGVEFSPTAAGASSGTLMVAANGIQSDSVALQGTGFDFTMTVSGASTQTISSGLTGSYTLVLTTLNGSQGTFALDCTVLPSNAACAFSPASPSVGSGASGNVTVQISTGTAAAGVRGERGAWPGVPVACGLALVWVGWRRRRTLLLCGLAMLLAAGMTSCTSAGKTSNGGSSGEGSEGGSTTTPAGTYSVPVSATANGVQHSVTLTLVVD
jgi:hypothetical protein